MTVEIQSVDVTKIGEMMYFADEDATQAKPAVSATVPISYAPEATIGDVRLRAVEAASALFRGAIARIDAGGPARFLSASDERSARLADEEAESLRDPWDASNPQAE